MLTQFNRFILAKSSRSPYTVAHYRSSIRSYLNHSGWLWPPTADSINEFLADCKKRGLKKGTLVTYRADICCFLHWLVQREEISPAILRDIEPQPRPRNVPRAVKKEHLRQIIGVLGDGADWRAARDGPRFRFCSTRACGSAN